MGRLATKQYFNSMDAMSTATLPNDIHIIELILGDNSHESVVLKACSSDTIRFVMAVLHRSLTE